MVVLSYLFDTDIAAIQAEKEKKLKEAQKADKSY
jgi:hypothetical protein